MSAIKVHETRNQFLRVGQELLDPAKSADQTRIVQLLKPAAVWDLAKARQAEPTVQLIGRLTPGRQTKILIGKDVIGELADRGGAAALAELIEKLPQRQQTRVLSAPYAVSNLAEEGQAARVATVIAKLPIQDQAKVLAACDAVRSLKAHGQSEAVVQMDARIKGLLPERHAKASTAAHLPQVHPR